MFRRAVHIITGEFLVTRKFSSSVLVALVAISRENMTNLHGDAVRKAHRGLGPLNLQTEISWQESRFQPIGPAQLEKAVSHPFYALYQIWWWVPDLAVCVIHISHPLCAHHAVTHPRSVGCDPLTEV